jgi:small GTP-binding protein
VIIGLDSAGKTTILNLLMKKEAGATLPTEGFNAETLKYKGDDKNLELTLWDLGGQDKLRQMWRHYYQGVQGIVFVVDATDVDRLGLAAKELQAALQDESLNAAGLLILCNKRDLKGAKSDAEISVMLGLDGPQSPTMALLGSRPFKLCSTSAEKDADSVFAAVDWLCSVMQPL